MPEGSRSRVELDGLDDAMRDMRRWAAQLGPDIEVGTQAFGDEVVRKVAARVPYLTGALARSVTHEALSTEDGFALGEGRGLEYAGWIEFGGSRGRPPVPEGRYLYPIAIGSQGEWSRAVADLADDTVRSYPWST